MKIRINNIECRKLATSKDEEYEIIKWYKNEYYGREDEYIENGWVLSNGFYKKNNTNIDKKFFDSEESCFVLAWLEFNRKEPDVNMKTVGGRVLELDEIHLKDFIDVYRIANTKILELNQNK